MWGTSPSSGKPTLLINKTAFGESNHGNCISKSKYEKTASEK